MSFTAYLSAEFLISQRSFTRRIPLGILGFMLLSVLTGFLVSPGALTPWFSVFVFFLALPTAVVTGVMSEHSDITNRGGGTWWRAIDPKFMITARVLVITGFLAVAALPLAILSPVLWGLAVVQMGIASGVGIIFRRLLGSAALLVGPAAAVVWSVAGAIRGEAASWIVEPWAWHVHAALPLLGVHHNSVPLNPGDAAWNINPWPFLVVGLALCAASTALAAITPRRSVSSAGRRASVTRASGARKSLHRAAALLLPWRTWWLLAIAMWLSLAAIRVLFPSGYALGFYAFVCVPVASAVVGVCSWTVLAPGWRGLRIRQSATRLPVVALMHAIFFACCVLTCGWILGVLGSDANFYSLLVTPFIVAMVSSISALLATLSLGVAIAFNAVALIWGLLIAGDVLAQSFLWPSGAWSWAFIADHYPERWILIILCCVLTSLAACFAFRLRTASRACLDTN